MNETGKEKIHVPGLVDTTGMSEDHPYQDSGNFLKCLLLQPVKESDRSLKCNGNLATHFHPVNPVIPVSRPIQDLHNMQKECHDEKSLDIQNQTGLNCVKNSLKQGPLYSSFWNCEYESDDTQRLSHIKKKRSWLSTKKQTERSSFVFCEENYINKEKYIFRDGNTKPELHFDEMKESFPKSTDNVSEKNNKTYKKRLDKLIQSLKEREKKLKCELKDAQVVIDTTCSKELNEMTRKLKENLKVTEKKKYESLINFEQSKCLAHNKAFQELLPGKMKQVDAYVEKHFEILKPKTGKRRKCKTAKTEVPQKSSYKKQKHTPKLKGSRSHTSNLQSFEKEESSVQAIIDDKSKFADSEVDCLKHGNRDTLKQIAIKRKETIKPIIDAANAVFANCKKSTWKKKRKVRKASLSRKSEKQPAKKEASKDFGSEKLKQIDANVDLSYKLVKYPRNKTSDKGNENKRLRISLKKELFPKATRSSTKKYIRREGRSENGKKCTNSSGDAVIKCITDQTLKPNYEEKYNDQSTESYEDKACSDDKKDSGGKAKIQKAMGKKKTGKSCGKKTSKSQVSKANFASGLGSKKEKQENEKKTIPRSKSKKKSEKSLKQKTPSAMFTLPPVSLLEKDYEIVSLSPCSSPRRGDFKTDQFFIPQCTINNKGKTGMIMVGPFKLRREPNPNLLLVHPASPENRKAMILQRKARSPSNTPPRDFRIKKDSKQYGAPCVPTGASNLDTVQVTLLDHNYVTPACQRDKVKRFNKAVAKQRANAEFIDARVENIESTSNNVLVTIKGDNMLRMVNRLSDPTQAPIKTFKGGIPVIYTLNQIMTAVLHKKAEHKKREKLAQISTKTGECTPILLPLSSIGDAVVEIVIPPGGTEILDLPSHKKHQLASLKEFKDFTDESQEVSGKAQLKPVKRWKPLDSVNFLHTNKSILVLDDSDFTEQDNQDPDQKQLESTERKKSKSISVSVPEIVPIENEEAVKIQAAWSVGSGLPCCSFCLRLFPSEAALHNHISSAHPIAADEVTQGLQAKNQDQNEQATIGAQSCEHLSSESGNRSLTCLVCQASDQPTTLNTKIEPLLHMRCCHNKAYANTAQDNPCFSKDLVQQNRCLLNDSLKLPAASDITCQSFACSEHTCTLCGIRFSDPQKLQVHLQIAHKSTANNQNNPRQMGHVMKSARRAKSKSRKSHLPDCLLCSKCNTAHKDRSSMLCHTLKVHPELNQFNVCRLCDRLFNSNLGLHRHLKKVHGLNHSGTLKCPFCPVWLPSMELASIHRVTLHTGALPVHCPFCGAGFQGMHGMYNHVRLHHLQTDAHVCPECQATFAGMRALTAHARKTHGMTAKVIRESLHSSNMATYCCPFCSTALSRTYELAMHVINDHGNLLLPRRCHLCFQAFVSDQVLKIHMAGAHGFEMADGLEGVDVTEDEVDDEEMEVEEEGRRFLQQQQQQRNQQDKILHQQQQAQHHIQHPQQSNQQYIFQQHQNQEQQHHILKQQQQEHYILQQQPTTLSQLEDYENAAEEHIGGAKVGQTANEGKYQLQTGDFEQQDLLETQEAGRFLEEMQEQQANSMNCLNETTQMMNLPSEEDTGTGQLFTDCSSLVEEVQMLNSHRTNLNLCGMDYLETLTNDSIAVGADVVAAGDAANKSQLRDGQDPIELAYQFEIDGVLYQLASSMGSSVHQSEPMNSTSATGEGLAHLLRK